MQTRLPAPIVFCPPNSHSAVRRAAALVAGTDGRVKTDGVEGADVVVGIAGVARAAALPERTFALVEEGGRLYITGDRPRTVLAGALYWLHHTARGTAPALPFTRTSPYRERLILEDFPFHCYAPTGFDFDPRAYAENLVALGYTSMECNRFSRREPLQPYWGNYLFTNPSVAPFVWTKWHEGVWQRDIVEANAAELRACVEVALEYDLDPSVTSFLPRPYPDVFFEVHPHLKGFYSRNPFLERGNHPGKYCVNTDHPDGLAFYNSVYAELLKANPEIRHFFFWHSDLGTRFWGDGEGPSKRTRAELVIEFHHEFQGVLDRAGVQAQVWINPWHMDDVPMEKLNSGLPPSVGYAVKETAGIYHYCGTTRIRLKDLNVICADIGEVPREIQSLAKKSGRPVCIGQYLDFSEDLDPIMGAPHPLMTFRKFLTLNACAHETSSTNWGILSPDVAKCRVNQDVIREMSWGAGASCIPELLPVLMPAGLGEDARGLVHDAWRKVDLALQAWPQFWGLRFEDSGLRLRWLVKPFLLECTPVPEEKKNYYLDHQLYRIDSPAPFQDFMDVTPAQAGEVSRCYSDMIELLARAEELFGLAAERAGAECREWIAVQIPPTRWMRLFFTTYKNLFAFHCLPERDILTARHQQHIREEIKNVDEILAHLDEARDCLVVASLGKWGQCFGPDVGEDFRKKRELLAWTLDTHSSGGLRTSATISPVIF
ncbi:hypothetical protein OH491_18060 [Termitidicoccus mucosus]|uniref:hypothetical protein n=1 Tax=Termitidicoccus mucosus TaxID=1184151 RepID=UPI0011AB3E96